MSYREGHYFKKGSYSQIATQGIDLSKYSLEELKALWRKTLEDGMYGICFSMYEDGQRPGDTITEEQVDRRVGILQPYAGWVRSFSCIEGNEHVPRMAKKHGLQDDAVIDLSAASKKPDTCAQFISIALIYLYQYPAKKPP